MLHLVTMSLAHGFLTSSATRIWHLAELLVFVVLAIGFAQGDDSPWKTMHGRAYPQEHHDVAKKN